MIDHARQEYRRMIALPGNSPERIYGQRYMAFLRDFIAEHDGRDPEVVQIEYEAAGNGLIDPIEDMVFLSIAAAVHKAKTDPAWRLYVRRGMKKSETVRQMVKRIDPLFEAR